VDSFQKTHEGLVAVKVEKPGSQGRHEVIGTGIIVDERGYVVTNCHVVGAGAHLGVVLADGTELSAQVVAEDAHYDLAVLRVRRSDGTVPDLQALPLGPGSDLMVGETVIAVGNPFGYTNTVSTGVISALGREIKMPNGEVMSDLIQTDASINPGNWGGPLLNVNGEVVGINLALREGAQGIAFAHSADTVQQVLSRHLSVRNVAGADHGLTCREELVPHGRPRQRIIVEAAAARTDSQCVLRPGDEIRRVDGRPISNRFDLERALWNRKPGEPVELTVVRDGKEMTVPLTLTGRGSQ
jgi:serine protease Do